MKIKLLLLIILPLFHFAQIVADRPGEGTSSAIVKPKAIQLESGVIYNRAEKSFTSDHLLRFGLTEKWEVRLQTNQNFINSDESTYGFSSKYNFIEGKNAAPSLTLIADSDFQFKDYSFVLTSDTEFNDSFAGAAGLGYLKNDSLDFYFVSFGLSYSITNQWNIFSEYYGYYNTALSPEHGADFGLTYLASPRLQLDFSFGTNVQDISNQYFLSTGISYQFK